MRSRRPHANQEPSFDGSAVSAASSPLNESASAGGPRIPLLDADDAALCYEYAIRLRKEAESVELRRPSLWRMRCSSSIFLGLLIWLVIGVVVYSSLEEVTPASLEPAASPSTPPTLLPEGCRGAYCLEEGGTEAFGAVLGAHQGVYAYSNCYAHSCVSLLDFEFPVPLPPGTHTEYDAPHATTRLMRTGMKWQCVEYARRYWMLRGTPAPAVFGSVEGAADIWGELSFVTLLDNVTTAPLFKYGNGVAVGYGGSAPREGDLVIYPRDDEGKFPYGHVAVIVGVELPADVSAAEAGEEKEVTGLVYIAEQNWHSNPWPEPYHNYSRSLPLKVSARLPGAPLRYTIHDDYHAIQGWVRYGTP